MKKELLDMLSFKDEQINRKDEQIKFLMDLARAKDKEISRLSAIIEGRRIHNARMIDINTYNQQ
jgi:hypothetical protein